MSRPQQRVLVTGSTSGIGLATARRLVDAGVAVVITGRNPRSVEAARDLLSQSADVPVDGIVADLHEASGTASLARELEERYPSLDGVVLSHGGPQTPEIFATSDPAGFEALAEALFLTNARLAHGLLPLLRRAPEGGRLVVVTSDAARYPTTGEVMIGALAAATVMFVRTFAREAARDGVRANVVTVTLTQDTLTYDRVLGASDFSRRLFEKAEARMPFGPVRADDVAATIVHLLSAAATAVTGQIVGVTGGLST